MASEAFYKLATIPWDICSMSEWMLGNIVPVHSYPFNGRHSRKTKNVLQYLWIILRPVGVWCWVLSTFFASLLIVTYITYVWQQELSDEQGQITKRKSCFPPTRASSTQTHAPNHQITGMLRGRERERKRDLPSFVQIIIGDIYQGSQIFQAGFMLPKETVWVYGNLSIQPKVANYVL